MRYLIDGHNLIPKLPGLSLNAIDDELRLVELLQEYCRRSRNGVEVYFDNAPPGQAGTRRYGTVSAHFIPRGRTADDAIRLRLGRLGRSGKNWTVAG
jgi:predicted RNA-binding protein with PIN domain